jgi:hypothetical protein
MMRSMQHPDESGSSKASSDLFSPIRARQFSLHSNTPELEDTLPRLQDTSWLGARVSPIPSLDEDEENDLVTAPYRNALQNSGLTERSSLLGGRRQMKSTIHPLWDPPPPTPQLGRRQRQPSRFAYTVIVATGIHLACVGLHDGYMWYLSYRRGIEPKYSLSWNLPWLGPSSRTLSRFGAFVPLRVLQGDYWRSVTALTATTSVVEWALIAWTWGRELRTTDTSGWPLLFLLSCITGQLWMTAFHENGISGCASWGTGGVACAMGVSWPNRRFDLFLCAIALVLVNLFQPYSSVYGAIGGSFFGWCCYGVSFVAQDKGGKKKTRGCVNWMAAIAVIKLWTIPIVYLVWKTFSLSDG